MSDWSLYGKAIGVTNYPAGGVSVTSDVSTANTYGAWVQMVASLPYDSMLIPQIIGNSIAKELLFDIGVGAAGSEVVLVDGILRSYTTGGEQSGVVFPLPIVAPAGTRVAFRCAASAADRTMLASCLAVHFGHFGQEFLCTLSDTYGKVAADTGGTEIDPGASANTDGDWVELAASSTRDSKALVFCIGNKGNAVRAAYTWSLDIAVGAAGSEIEIVSDYGLWTAAAADSVGPYISPIFPIPIPIGTRISARAKCTGTDATDRLFDIVIYTFS